MATTRKTTKKTAKDGIKYAPTPFYVLSGWVSDQQGKFILPSINRTHYKTLTAARKNALEVSSIFQQVIYRIIPGPRGYTGHIVGSVGSAYVNGKLYTKTYCEFIGQKRIKQGLRFEYESIHGRTWILNKDGTLGRRIN